jgi:putative Ca2+/H+ antiporter (TMEM165/GDT1 family)
LEALYTSFLAAALAEWGDKSQLLVVALAVRFRQPAPILAGVGVAALAHALIAAAGGVLIHDLVVARAASLLVAVALLFAGLNSLAGRQPPDLAGWKAGAFVTAAASFFLLEFGDKTQFLTAALAAHFDSLVLAAIGATAGVLAASLPAALLGDRLAALVPLRAIRIGVAALFLLAGFIAGVNALGLI